MKKMLLLPAIVAVTLLTLSSCKKDEGNNDSIIGTWEATSMHYSYSVNTVPPVNQTVDSNYTHGKSIVVTVKSDNTYTEVDNTETPASTDLGTYTLLTGKIALKSSTSATADTLNYTVANNVLTLSQVSSQTIGGFTATYNISEVLARQ